MVGHHHKMRNCIKGCSIGKSENHCFRSFLMFSASQPEIEASLLLQMKGALGQKVWVRVPEITEGKRWTFNL